MKLMKLSLIMLLPLLITGCTLTPQEQAIQNDIAAVTPVANKVVDGALIATGNAAVVPLNDLAVQGLEAAQRAQAAGNADVVSPVVKPVVPAKQTGQ